MNQSIFSYRRGQQLLFVLLLLVHTVASYYYISQQNITYDEPQYIEYAKRWLHGKPDRVVPLDDSKSPVVAVCWIPRIVRQIINPHYKLTDYGRKDQAEGRYMMILFSFLAAFYVYKWCRDLYGAKGWWLPLILLLFDPLYLAYSTLITTDLACGAFLVALLYHYCKYLLTGCRRQFMMAACYTGIAIVTKQTLLFVVFLLPIITIVFYWNEKKSKLNRYALAKAIIFMLFVLLVINISFYFTNTFIPFGKYDFESKTLNDLQNGLPYLHWMPVPFPKAYVQSIDLIKAHAELGAGKVESTYSGVYLFGQLNVNGGYWYYYIVTFFFKMPIGILLLLCFSVVLFLRNCRQHFRSKTYLFVLFPIIFYGIILSFFNNFQTGIRHLLVIYPLMYIALGKVLYEVCKMKLSYKIATAALILYSFISVVLYYPFIIPYTNELVANKKKIYKIMMDSSIDYGQSDSSVNKFMIDHQEYNQPSSEPTKGKFVIPMGHIVNIRLQDKNPYLWYQKMEPTGLYRNVILLYDIKQQDLINAGYINYKNE